VASSEYQAETVSSDQTEDKMNSIRKPRFNFTKSISPTPMTSAEWESCEDVLARMVARSIAVDQGWLKVEENKRKGSDYNV